MRGNAHVRFGGRAGETERPKGRHRALVRPYYVKVREGGRVVSMAALVATGVGDRRAPGARPRARRRQRRGHAWPTFIRSLVERGLAGVRLVISDDHRGLVKAVHEQLLGASWQRCRVHFTRNAQDLVPRSARGMIATVIRSIFEQPDEAQARAQLRRVVDGLEARFPAVAPCSSGRGRAARPLHLPGSHRRQIRGPTRSERFNKEIKRRTAVVGIFPTRAH